MPNIKHNLTNKQRRSLRQHFQVVATADRPKVVITRTNQHFYLQVVNVAGQVIASQSDKSLLKAGTIKTGLTKTERAAAAGKALAANLQELKITKVAIDRGANKYHGRLKAAVEALKENGVEA